MESDLRTHSHGTDVIFTVSITFSDIQDSCVGFEVIYVAKKKLRTSFFADGAPGHAQEVSGMWEGFE